MKKATIGLVLLSLLMSLLAVQAESKSGSIVIAVTNPYDAWQPVIEEAFYQQHPDAEIVYRLYAVDQLKTTILSGKVDFDLLIQPISEINSYGQGGYLRNLYPTLGLKGWPNSLLNVREQIELEGALYGMPLTVHQSLWAWNDALADAVSIKKPFPTWTWEDYATLSDQFPVDMNLDGVMDAYLMYGSKTQESAMPNVQLDNLYSYLESYPGDFRSERFLNQLQIFTRIVSAPSLLAMDTASPPLFNEAPAVLISSMGTGSPLSLLAGEYNGYSFLPIPLFSDESVFYLGGSIACAMMIESKHDALATAFLQTIISPNAMDSAFLGNEINLVYRQMPKQLWLDMNSVYSPSFQLNSKNTYVVPKGRAFQVEEFPYTQEQFETAQAYREKLKLPASSVGRPFYDAFTYNLAKWQNGALTIEGVTQAMQETYGMIMGE